MISKNEFLKQKAVEILKDRVENRIISLGEIAPNVKVKTFSNETISLFDLLKNNHLILSFMRGSWWPYCRGELEVLKGLGGYFNQVNGKVAVVTREEIEESTFVGKGAKLFDIKPEDVIMISDPKNELGKLLNLTYIAMDEIKSIYKELGLDEEVEGYFDTSELNVPATFILTQNEGRIIYKYGKRDVSNRAPGGDLLDTLLKLRGPK